jgi:hypothetical protein
MVFSLSTLTNIIFIYGLKEILVQVTGIEADFGKFFFIILFWTH